MPNTYKADESELLDLRIEQMQVISNTQLVCLAEHQQADLTSPGCPSHSWAACQVRLP